MTCASDESLGFSLSCFMSWTKSSVRSAGSFWPVDSQS